MYLMYLMLLGLMVQVKLSKREMLPRYPSRRTPLQPPLQINTNTNKQVLQIHDKSKQKNVKRNTVSIPTATTTTTTTNATAAANDTDAAATTTPTTTTTNNNNDSKMDTSSDPVSLSTSLESCLKASIYKHSQTNDHASALFHANLLYSIQKTPTILIQIAQFYFQLHDYANALETILQHSLHITSIATLYYALLSLVNLKT